jgi:hypothetical protein
MPRYATCTLLAIFAAHTAAAQTAPPDIKELRKKQEVEVAPGKWLSINKVDRVLNEELPSVERLSNRRAVERIRTEESTELTIPWKSTTVRWKSSDIPVSLREFEGSLYLIAFDRSQDEARLRYYAEKENTFEEIEPADYPKRIATQNLWFQNTRRGAGDRRIDPVDLAVKLDPDDIYFAGTLTATIWCELSTGKPYETAEGLASEARSKIVREYSEKYSPIKLTQIDRSGRRR